MSLQELGIVVQCLGTTEDEQVARHVHVNEDREAQSREGDQEFAADGGGQAGDES